MGYISKIYFNQKIIIREVNLKCQRRKKEGEEKKDKLFLFFLSFYLKLEKEYAKTKKENNFKEIKK